MNSKRRAPQNRTLTLSEHEESEYLDRLLMLDAPATVGDIENRTIKQDIMAVLPLLPTEFVDVLFIDPPYNLTKQFNSNTFREMSDDEYEAWIESWLLGLVPTLKPTASIYFCGDWRCSAPIQRVLSRHFKLRNRITWEREKGRGAKANWKNCSEDIWFATVSDSYYFNPEAVKLKRKVLAPYRDAARQPKDWLDEPDGQFRATFPSNLWTDVTVPFWSMPENTDHPTQKPEKLVAKIVLASSQEGDFILDPFLGSGTTSVVARKLGRRFAGIEVDSFYACLAEKRLRLAEVEKTIQGYADGVFWERNSLAFQRNGSNIDPAAGQQELAPRLL